MKCKAFEYFRPLYIAKKDWYKKTTNLSRNFHDLTVSVLRTQIHLKNEEFKRMIYEFP